MIEVKKICSHAKSDQCYRFSWTNCWKLYFSAHAMVKRDRWLKIFRLADGQDADTREIAKGSAVHLRPPSLPVCAFMPPCLVPTDHLILESGSSK